MSTKFYCQKCCAERFACPTTRATFRLLLELLVQRENHVNCRIDFDRLAVESGRLISPLAHRIKRGLDQERMPRHYLELLNRAVLRNDRVQAHGAGDARLA